MKVDKVLEEIIKFSKSSEGKKLMEKVSKLELPQSLTKFAEKYENTCKNRDTFLWK